MGYSRFHPAMQTRAAWNAGKTVGTKRPLTQKQIWAIRFHLDREGRLRDKALFDLAINSKLRGCDLVKIEDRRRGSGSRRPHTGNCHPADDPSPGPVRVDRRRACDAARVVGTATRLDQRLSLSSRIDAAACSRQQAESALPYLSHLFARGRHPIWTCSLRGQS